MSQEYLIWRRGARTFEHDLQVAFWDQTNSGVGTGYRDPGWSRQASEPTPEELIDRQGRLHRYAAHNLHVPHACDLMGISVGDLRRYFGLEIRRRPYPKYSSEHSRSRTMSGCFRHSGSLVPELGRRLGREFGLDCVMDTGGWFLVDEILDKANRYIYA